MKIIGIAGGSGSGKSTVSYALVDNDPEIFEVINLDDYQKLKSEPDLPMFEDMINWDHPDIIRWNDLINDINKLRNGVEITINTWAHRSNHNYEKLGQMIPRIIKPRPVIIVEGYLALFNPKLNELFDKKFYLELDQMTRKVRRDKNTIVGHNDYETKVLEPMFKKFVEPTQANADTVIDVGHNTASQVAQLISASAQIL